MAHQWFVIRGDEQDGPISVTELKELAVSGQLQPEEFVRRDDMQTPVQASKVKGLFPDRTTESAITATEPPPKEQKLALNKVIKKTSERFERAEKTATRLAAIAAAISGIAGSLGDILKPLANVNLAIFLLAGVSTLGLLVLCVVKRSSVIKFKLGIACLVAFCVSAVFGVWAGLGALPGDKEKGFLASRLPVAEKIQESLVPQPERSERKAVRGTLQLLVDPPDARVWIDGALHTLSNSGTARVDLDEGEHQIKVEKTGYEPAGRQVVILSEKVVDLAVRLSLDHEFRGAEWVLGKQGTVRVIPAGDTKIVSISKLERLPSEPFIVIEVDLKGIPLLDSELAKLTGLKRLETLVLTQTGITGRGLTAVQDSPTLRSLSVHETPCTDEGAASVGRMRGLTTLWLSGTKVTNIGLKHIGKLDRLETLYLGGVALTDDGLIEVGKLTNLEFLGLHNTRVTDKGIAHLRGLHKLKKINLGGTKVTDRAVKQLFPACEIIRPK